MPVKGNENVCIMSESDTRNDVPQSKSYPANKTGRDDTVGANKSSLKVNLK